MAFLTAIKYLFLIPFHPLRFFEDFEEDSGNWVHTWAFWIAMAVPTIFGAIAYMQVEPNLPLILPLIMIFFFRVMTAPVFALVFFALSHAFKYKNDMSWRIIASLIGFSFLPEFLYLIFCHYMPAGEVLSYLYWITFIWQGVIIVLGSFKLSNQTIGHACVIGGGAFLILRGMYFITSF